MVPSASAFATSARAQASGASSLAKDAALLGGPWVVAAGDQSDAGDAELTLRGDPRTRQVESVWLRARLSDSNTEVRLVYPFFSGVRLLDAEPRKTAVYLHLETMKALSQPAGLRAVVGFGGTVAVPSSGVPYVRHALRPLAVQPGATDWRSAIEHEKPSLDAVENMTKLKRAEQWAPRGLSLERLWQGTFREHTAEVASTRLATHPKRKSWERLMTRFRESFTAAWESPCENLAGWQCADWEDEAFWLELIDDEPRVTTFGQAPHDVLAKVPIKHTRDAPELTRDENTDLDAKIGRLPFEAKEVLRGRLSGRVPFAVLSPADLTTSAGLLLLGGDVSRLLPLDDLTVVRKRLGPGTLQAGIWDHDSDGTEDIVLHYRSNDGETWTGLVAIEWLTAPFSPPVRHDAVTFWAHGAAGVAGAIEAMAKVPRRGVSRSAALALFRRSKTVAGMQANTTSDARFFDMEGWWDAAVMIRRKDERSPAQLTDDDLLGLPDGSDETMIGCCSSLHCDNDVPRCYCYRYSCGVSSQYWFEWEKGRLELAGVGHPTD